MTALIFVGIGGAMKLAPIILSAFTCMTWSASKAEEVTFMCYDLLAKHNGFYDSPLTFPVTLIFDTLEKTVTQKTGFNWDCDVIRWGDPMIYFSCLYEHERDLGTVTRQGDLSISIGVFDRNSARYAWQALSPISTTSVYDESEVGQRQTSKINVDYDVCERKQF